MNALFIYLGPIGSFPEPGRNGKIASNKNRRPVRYCSITYFISWDFLRNQRENDSLAKPVLLRRGFATKGQVRPLLFYLSWRRAVSNEEIMNLYIYIYSKTTIDKWLNRCHRQSFLAQRVIISISLEEYCSSCQELNLRNPANAISNLGILRCERQTA